MEESLILPEQRPGHAASGGGALSARLASALHFRTALSHHAGIRFEPSPHVRGGHAKPPQTQWNSPADFFEIAGVGLIRACVGRNDGTSNLILQGLERVRFTGFENEEPYPLATVRALESDYHSSVETEALAAKVLEIYSKFKGAGRQLPEKVDRYLSDLGDPEMLADLVASTFVSDTSRRQRILEELSVNQRLRLLIQYLRDESGSAAA